MDKNKYTEKCMLSINAKHFKKLHNHPKNVTERKIQRMLQKSKPKLSEDEEKVLYPLNRHQESSTAQLKSMKFPKMVT